MIWVPIVPCLHLFTRSEDVLFSFGWPAIVGRTFPAFPSPLSSADVAASRAQSSLDLIGFSGRNSINIWKKKVHKNEKTSGKNNKIQRHFSEKHDEVCLTLWSYDIVPRCSKSAWELIGLTNTAVPRAAAFQGPEAAIAQHAPDIHHLASLVTAGTLDDWLSQLYRPCTS